MYKYSKREYDAAICDVYNDIRSAIQNLDRAQQLKAADKDLEKLAQLQAQLRECIRYVHILPTE